MAVEVPNIMASVKPCSARSAMSIASETDSVHRKDTDGVPHHAREEDLSPAVDVGYPSQGHEEHGGGQQVGGRDPAQRDRVDGKLPADGREGDVDGRRHERREKGRRGGDKQDDSPVDTAPRHADRSLLPPTSWMGYTIDVRRVS